MHKNAAINTATNKNKINWKSWGRNDCDRHRHRHCHYPQHLQRNVYNNKRGITKSEQVLYKLLLNWKAFKFLVNDDGNDGDRDRILDTMRQETWNNRSYFISFVAATFGATVHLYHRIAVSGIISISTFRWKCANLCKPLPGRFISSIYLAVHRKWRNFVLRV